MLQIELAQAFIDTLAYFLLPFAILYVITWVTSLFRSR